MAEHVITLVRRKLDSDGYDTAGAYWGSGSPLYWASDERVLDDCLRADDDEGAKAQVLALHPAATVIFEDEQED